MICNCKYCGKKFKGRRESQYCGKYCTNLAACKSKVKCVICGKEVKRHGRNCCSIWCRGILQTRRAIEDNTTHCTNCNKKIVKRAKVQKGNKFGVFCNLRCSSDYKSKYYFNKRKRLCKI